MIPLYLGIDSVYSLDPLSTQTKSTFHPRHQYALPTTQVRAMAITMYTALLLIIRGKVTRLYRPLLQEGGRPTIIGPWVNHYRFEAPLIGDCCGRVLSSIYSAKASHAQLHDMPLQSDTQALRLTTSIPLIQRREKCRSREEKSAFT